LIEPNYWRGISNLVYAKITNSHDEETETGRI